MSANLPPVVTGRAGAGSPGAGLRLDMLGVWALPSEPLVFALTDQPVAWQLELPVTANGAAAALADARARLELTERALDAAEMRFATLDDALARIPVGPGVSFDVSAAAAPLENMPDAENKLLIRLGVLQQTGGAVAYGLDLSAIPVDIPRMMTDGQALLDQISRFLSLFASVDTFIAGQFVARTEVQWSGAARTVWRSGLTAEQAALHYRLLDLTLHTREIWLRVAALVVRMAARVATILASPISAAFLIPAIWQFIQDIRTELENLNTAKNTLQEAAPPASG